MQTKSTRSKKPAAHSLHRLVEMFDSPAQRLKCHAAAYVETSAKYFAADDWNALAAEWIVRSSPQMLGLFTRNKTRSDSTEKTLLLLVGDTPLVLSRTRRRGPFTAFRLVQHWTVTAFSPWTLTDGSGRQMSGRSREIRVDCYWPTDV